MAENINDKIQLIDESLSWIKKNRPEQYEQKFVEFVRMRSELRRISEAELDNPAVAAYGESQKGKSYLIGNLLQNNGVPYLVKVRNADGKIESYDFVKRINPMGDNREATGAVTRFTSYNKHPEFYSEEYPARMKVFSVANLILILTDGYYNDVTNYSVPSDEEFRNKADSVYNRYANGDDVQDVIVEDDIFDIQAYLKSFVNPLKNLANSGFFEKIALVIRKIPEQDWLDVFKILWQNEDKGVEEIHRLFIRLVSCLKRLGYSRYIYLPVEAVLHKGSNENTIMSVGCLNGLYSGKSLSTEVYVKEGDAFRKVGSFDKSEISALCCEVAYKVEVDENQEFSDFYFDSDHDGQAGYMTHNVYRKLSGERISKKELFRHSDFLDFPGAKNRESLDVRVLPQTDNGKDVPSIVKMLLRGKVAYLFNYYSVAKLINILMFCHDDVDNKVTTMYKTIETWVNSYVGKNAEERRNTVRLSGGIAPLFVIGTKFNIDMRQKGDPDGDGSKGLHNRWKGRFEDVLYTACFHAGEVDWFKNWTGYGQSFNNTYLLRDYKYSGCDGNGNNLFQGYNILDKSPKETALELPSSFYELLHDTFVSDDNVKKFFQDPEVAWEVASTMNNDGSLYVIKRLCTISFNLDSLRTENFRKGTERVMASLKRAMSAYYVDTDVTNLLEEKISLAKSVNREMDFACNADNYFFGHFIKMLQVEYRDVYSNVHRLIQSHELNASVQAWSRFELIRRNLEGCETESECWDRLISVYGFRSRDEAAEYLESQNVSAKDLFSFGKKRERSNSSYIAEKIFGLWKDRLQSPSFLSRLSDDSRFDTGVLDEFVRNLLETAEKLDIVDVMSKSIATYVNVTAVHTANEYAVSDILTEIIDSFVTDLGFGLREKKDIDNCRSISKEYSLPVFRYIGKESKSAYDEDELTALFVGLQNNPDAVTSSFENHYNLWLEYMYVSFVNSAGNIPTIGDIEANNAVKTIIESL